MLNKTYKKTKKILGNIYFWLVLGVLYLVVIVFSIGTSFFGPGEIYEKVSAENTNRIKGVEINLLPELDKEDYDRRMLELANNPAPKIVASSTSTSTAYSTSTKKTLWPVNTVYPSNGAILPFKRVIAYYGNLYSKGMGVLGQYEEDVMLAKLKSEVDKWTLADPNTPAIPALHYIAVTAQLSAGADGKYRLRMPDSQIDEVLRMAKKIDAITFLDIQVGLSTIQDELPLLEKYLKLPEVNLGVDPEFYMKTGIRPGRVIGTMDAIEINYVINHLAKIVKENNLPPKILIIHRFTQNMLTNYQDILVVPEVQVVIDMDGWGGQAKKLNTYRQFIASEPVQFTGFKLFYKNDVLQASTTLMTPETLLKQNPRPIYIQYQ